ncbi:MAG: DUF6895 family protein [Candidatus Rokuibacteriota bacterium]
MGLAPAWRRDRGSGGAAPGGRGRAREIGSPPLSAFASRALGWLERHLRFFDPFRDGPEPVGPHSRAFLELSYLTMLCLRQGDRAIDRKLEPFLRLIHGVWARPGYRECIVRSPERLAWYLMPYLVLERTGRADPSYRDVIQRVLAHACPTAIEDVSFRQLAWRHLLDLGGFRHDVASYTSLYRHTLLAGAMSLAYHTRYDVSCLTHALFALSDVGSRPIDVIPRHHAPVVRRTLATLLGLYEGLEDWDVVGELLLGCRCLRWAPPVAFESAWSALRRAQRPDGAIPGRALPAGPRRAGAGHAAADFRHNYHPTLVGALTAVLSERWAAAG